MKKILLLLLFVSTIITSAQETQSVMVPPPTALSFLDAIDPDNDGYTSFNIAGYITNFKTSMLAGFGHYNLYGYIVQAHARQSNNSLVPITTPFFTNTILNQGISLTATYSGSGIQYDQNSLDSFMQAYGGNFTLRTISYNGNPDNDGVLNGLEDLNGNLDPLDDNTDGDTLPNYNDNDDDNDGILTINEDYNGNGSPLDDDMNSNGIPDYLDNLARGSLPLNLKLFIEGYYAGSSMMRPVKFNQDGLSPTTDVENITVELHHATTPFSLAASTTGLLKTNGNVACSFPTASVGSYYIVVKSSNGIETWSATPQSISSIPLTYNFSTTADKAYGNNMKNLGGGIYGLFSGDINCDTNIDTIDFPIWQADSNNFLSGLHPTDLNGDGNVDTIDYPILELNADNFTSVIRP